MDGKIVEGSASALIELNNGVITVTHGDSKEVLAKWTAEVGDWEFIWQIIRILEAGDAVGMKEF